MKKILIFMCTVLLFAACYEDEHIQGEYVDYGRAYDTTSTDPAWKFVSQYYYKYAKHIILDPKPEDYVFDFQSKFPVKMEMLRDDRAYVAKAVEVFKELFLNCYGESARDMMFPYALILADSLEKYGNGKYTTEKIITTNRYIAFAVNDQVINGTEEEKVEMSILWNSTFLQYCISKIGWTAPDAFYLYSDEEYGKMQNWFITGVEEGDMDAVWEKGYPSGVWTDRYVNGELTWGYSVSSSREGYLEKFIEFLLTTPQKTIDGAIAKHAKLKNAHDVLDKSLKENFAIDYRTMVYKAKK